MCSSPQLSQLLSQLHEKPTDASLLYQLAYHLPKGGCIWVCLLNGEVTTKQQLLLQSVQLDATMPLSLYLLAYDLDDGETITLLNGKRTNSRGLFLKVIDLQVAPSCINAFLQLGILLKKGETIRLLNGTSITRKRAFIKCLQRDPTNSFALLHLAISLNPGETVLRKNGKRMNSKQLISKAIKHKSTEPYFFHRLAFELKTGERVRVSGIQMDSRQLYLKAIDLNPGYVFCLHGLGTLLSEDEQVTLLNGTKMTRKDLFLQAVDLNQHPTSSNEALGMIFYTLATNLLPTETLQLLNGSKMTKQQLLLNALKAWSNSPHPYYELSLTLQLADSSIALHNGTKVSKRQLLLKVLELNPYHSFAYLELGLLVCKSEKLVLHHLGSLNKKAFFLTAIQCNPYLSRGYSHLADCDPTLFPGYQMRIRFNERESRLGLYTRAIQLDENDYYPFFRLGVTLTTWKEKLSSVQLRNGRILSREECFLEAVARNPTFLPAHRYLSYSMNMKLR
jgi:hypothetical protein